MLVKVQSDYAGGQAGANVLRPGFHIQITGNINQDTMLTTEQLDLYISA